MAEQILTIDEDWNTLNSKNTLKPKEIIIENALVAILGISKYDSPYDDLDGVIDDVKTMKNLWNGYFGYIVNYLDPYKPTTKDELTKFISSKIQYPLLSDTANHDALIICLFGHGCNDEFITSDKKSYNIKALQDHFCAKALPLLSTSPKLFILDLCRGDQFPEDIKVPQTKQWKFRGVSPKTVHEDSDISLIYSNTANFKVPDGGPFTSTMKTVMEQCNLCENDLNNIVTMIAEKVALDTPLLCVEHVTRQKYSIKFRRREEPGKTSKYSHEKKYDKQGIDKTRWNQLILKMLWNKYTKRAVIVGIVLIILYFKGYWDYAMSRPQIPPPSEFNSYLWNFVMQIFGRR